MESKSNKNQGGLEEEKSKIIDLQFVDNNKKRKRRDMRPMSGTWDTESLNSKKRKLNEHQGGKTDVVKVSETQVCIIIDINLFR